MAEQELHRRRRNVEEDDVVGFANDTTTLVKLLTDQGNMDLEVVSIIGMGGLGKTTLARKIYNNTLVKDRFKDCCAWVDVSQRSQTKGVLLDILNCFTTVSDRISQRPVEELKVELGKCLKEKRYFVVLDDIWDTQVWEEVREAFPNDLNGSRILITSRENGVAPYDSPTIPYFLQFLDLDSSWELLSKKAFRGQECPSSLVTVGKKLAESCKGLPLSIVLLGGILANKRKLYQIWSKFVGNVNAHLTVGISILTLSYNQLPQHLKSCFMYLCLFPEDYEISVNQLTELWIAEGFVQPTVNRTAYDIAEEYLEQLIDGSLVQVASRRYDGGVKTCCIHDILRDLCIRESSQAKFLGIYSNDNISSVSKFRQLSFQYKDYQSYSNFRFDKLPSARSLLIFNNTTHHLRTDYILKPICKWTKLVRVLSIDGELIKAIPRQIGELIFLRLLWIYRGKFEKLPSSIFKLGHLETIHLDSKVYNQLPKGIWMMKRLRHLHVSKFTKLPDLPSSMGSPFSNLQVLSGLLVQRNTALVIAKCPNIRKLRLMLVYNNNEEPRLRETEMENAMKNIGKLEYLESFKFESVYKGSHEKIRISLGLEPLLPSKLLTKISLTYPSFGLDQSIPASVS
nr:disease resistance protein RPP13-like [Ziziphus jujuba var. spinosa]